MSQDSTPRGVDSEESVSPASTPREPAPQEPAVDEKGRRLFDENGQPIHWATRYGRVVALVLALVVIAITIAFAYSLSTGDLIRR